MIEKQSRKGELAAFISRLAGFLVAVDVGVPDRLNDFWVQTALCLKNSLLEDLGVIRRMDFDRYLGNNRPVIEFVIDIMHGTSGGLAALIQYGLMHS